MPPQNPTTSDPYAQDQITQVPADRREGMLGLIGGHGKSASIDDMVKQHHDARLTNAQMYANASKTAVGNYLHAQQGIDPRTNQRFDDPEYKGTNPITGQPFANAQEAKDALQQYYNNQHEEAWGNYTKIAGVNPEAKGALGKAQAILQHIMGKGAVQGVPQQPQRGNQMAAPPAASTPNYPTTVGEAGVTQNPAAAPQARGMAPPPQAPSGPSFLAQAPFLRAQEEFTRGLGQKRQDMLSTQQTQHEIWEDEAKKLFDPGSKEYKWYSATGKLPPASNQRPPRPAGSYSTSVLDARKRASNGEVFFSPAGDPIDLDVLDPSMGLKGVMVYDEDSKKWGVRYEPFSPNQDVVKIGGVGIAVNKMDKSKIPEGAGTELGPAQIATTTATHSPETGQTTVSTKTPQITGVPGRNGISAPPPAPQGRTAGVPSVAPPPAAPSGKAGVGGGVPKVSKVAPTELPALDKNGHIPATVVAKSTPQVVEGANQLLDGKDVKDLPAKTKELSASMARHYGWEQGKFTPREQGALRNATQFIDDMLSDPSTFAVLDDTMSRLKLNQVIAGSGHQGTISSAASTLAAKNMSDSEARFIRQYNIITQTLAGIAPAIRGSGNRTTEAAIQRLLTDMPNPKTVQGAKDGMERLQLLKKEVQRALAKGQFTEADAAAATVPTRKSANPPPKPGERPPLSSFEH